MGALPDGVVIESGSAEDLALPQATSAEATANPGRAVAIFARAEPPAAVAFEESTGRFVRVSVRIPEARRAVLQLYGLTAAALLAVYGLVAAALELFVLPQNVYSPIRRLLDADAAVQAGQQDRELIPEEVMPADELGEIMRSRNESIVALRRGERALGEALAELETFATDLTRKNHLLQTAQRNLADADRLASLGMMSAGLAHELNTPLTVLKGLVEKLHENPERGIDREHAALMLRVVKRLERLGESLLDFARVRPPETRPVGVPLAGEARPWCGWTAMRCRIRDRRRRA
jgi:signal transduction histidine kinase